MSMAARSTDLDDQKPGINIQTEGHTLTPPSGLNDPEDPEAFGSVQSCSPSQFSARKLTSDWPETHYCLEIQVTSTKDERVTPPPHHTWQVPLVEDMAQDSKAGLTEAVVTGPNQAILFYGLQSLGEGLSFGEAWDAMFTLSGVISWVGKQAQPQYQTSKPGWWLVVDHPSHHQRTHQTKRTWSPLFHSSCLDTIQFL